MATYTFTNATLAEKHPGFTLNRAYTEDAEGFIVTDLGQYTRVEFVGEKYFTELGPLAAAAGLQNPMGGFADCPEAQSYGSGVSSQATQEKPLKPIEDWARSEGIIARLYQFRDERVTALDAVKDNYDDEDLAGEQNLAANINELHRGRTHQRELASMRYSAAVRAIKAETEALSDLIIEIESNLGDHTDG